MSNEEEETLLPNSNQPENSNTFNIAEKEPLEYIPFDSSHNSTSKEQTGSDKFAYALLGLLFFIESLPLGLFGASIPLILVANGSDFMDLAEFSVVALPYMLKIFLAPVFDSTQPHPYGKRKTFLVPNLLFGGAVQILISFWIQGIVDNANVHIITLVGFLISLISAVIDIIANGWVVSLVSQKNLAHVPTVHKAASSLGIFLSFNAFIPLNSVDFCNKYIYSEPRDTPVFTLSGFALASGMGFVAATIFLHFFNEPDFPEEHHATFHDIKEALKLFWRNPKLKLLTLSALFSGFGIYPVLAIFIPNLIQQGIPKEIVANLSTFLLPLAILSVVIIGFINKKHKQEFTIIAVGYVIGAITVVIPIYATLYLHVQTHYDESLYLLIALSALVIVVTAIKMMPWQSFSYRIAHESMATTFLVIVFSLRLLGIYWPSLIVLLIGDYVNLTLIAIVSTGLSIVYLVWFWRKVRPLQDLATRDFGFYKETQVLV